jgi:hypothetical protein
MILVGALLISAAIGYLEKKLLQPSDQSPVTPDPDAKTQTTAYGVPIPKVYGTNRIPGNVIWQRHTPNYTTGDDHGAGNETLWYTHLAVQICAGPVDRVLRIWDGDDVVVDFTLQPGGGLAGDYTNCYHHYAGDVHAALKVADHIRVYTGTESQGVDPTLYSFWGPAGGGGSPPSNPDWTDDGVPAFRGTCYIVFDHLWLWTGNWVGMTDRSRLPNFTFEVAGETEQIVPCEPLVPSISIPPGTVRQMVGFELGMQEMDYISTPISTADTQGHYSQDVRISMGEEWVHSGDYSAVCETYNDGTYPNVTLGAFFRVPITLNDDSHGGSVIYNATDANPLYLSFWMKMEQFGTDVGGTIFEAKEVCYFSNAESDGYGSLCRTEHTGNPGDPPAGGVLEFRAPYPNSGAICTGTHVISCAAPVWGAPKAHFIQVFIDARPYDETSRVTVYVDGEFDMTGEWNSVADHFLHGICRVSFNGGGGTSLWAYSSKIQYDDIVFSATDWNFHAYPSQTGEAGFGVPSDGDYKILRLPPVGPGDHSDWTGDYTDVDEAPRDNGTYIYHTGAGRHSFQIGPIAEDTTQILAVKVSAADRGSWSADDLGLLAKSGDVDVECHAIPVYSNPDVTIWDQLEKVYTRDFGRSDIPWTSANVAALQVGVYSGTVAGTNRCSQVAATVLCTNNPVGGPDDNIVMHPDQAHVVMETAGVWDVVHIADPLIHPGWPPPDDGDYPGINVVELHAAKVYDDIPEYPVTGCDFDIDSSEHIYTCKWTHASDVYESVPAIIDGTTLADVTVGDAPIYNPTRVRVSRYASAPFVVMITDGGANLTWLGKVSLNVLATTAAPEGYSWVSMSIDDETGDVFALAVGEDSQAGDVFVKYYPYVGTPVEYYPPEIADAEEILFDPESSQVLIGSRTPAEQISFYDFAALGHTLTHTVDLTGDVMPDGAKSAWRAGVVGGFLIYAHDTSRVSRVDVVNHTQDKFWAVDPVESGGSDPIWAGGSAYDARGNSVISGVTDPDWYYVRVMLNEITATAAILSDIVDDVCSTVGLTSVSTSALSDQVTGFAITNRQRARDAMQPLLDAYFFDRSESDGVVRFPKRGAVATITIPEADLGAYEESAPRPDMFPREIER